MSKTSVFVKAQDFHPTIDNVDFNNPEWSSTGYASLNLKYRSFELILQSPQLMAPFGFSRGMPNSSSFNKDFNLQFNLDSATKKTQAFYQGLSELEDVIVRHFYHNRVQLGIYGNQTEAEKATLEDVRKKFSPIIRQAKPGSGYSPTFKVNFRTFYEHETKKVSIITTCDDHNKETIIPTEETIPRFSKCVCRIQLKNMWISPKGTFGVKWQINQLKVCEKENSGTTSFSSTDNTNSKMITGECLLDSDDED